MNKSMVWEVIKNILAVILAFIISIIIYVAIVICIDVGSSPPVVIKYNTSAEDLHLDGLKKLANNPPEYCASTTKIKDNKNHVRYSSCKYEDLISYGKNREIIAQSKVFDDYYLDENNNLIEYFNDNGMMGSVCRYAYNDSGKVILFVYLSGEYYWYPMVVSIYK